MSKVVPLLETIFQNKGGSSKLWKATNEVLLQRSDEAKNFCNYMKNKLRDLNQDTQLLALDFLDYSMDDGKMPLWTQVSSKEFLSNLVNLLKTRDAPEVQMKILFWLEKWGRKFDKYKTIIPNFSEVYMNLKNSGITFPEGYQSNYSKYTMSNEDNTNEYSGGGGSGNNNNNYNYNYNNDFDSSNNNYGGGSNDYSNNENSSEAYINNMKVDLNENSYDKKYRKLVRKWNEWGESIGVANATMDNKNMSRTARQKWDGIIEVWTKGQNQIIETIGSEKWKDEKWMEITLLISDDINRTNERYKNLKNGKKVDPFLSSFVEKRAQNDKGPTKKSKNSGGGAYYNQNKGDEKTMIFFDDDGGNNSNNQQMQPQSNQGQSNQQSSSINDWFDIFSNPQPVNDYNDPSVPNNYPQFQQNMSNNIATNMNNQFNMNNNMGNMNNNIPSMNSNIGNMNSNVNNMNNNIPNWSNNMNNNTNAISLADQLQMAYQPSTANNNQIPNVNMNMNMNVNNSNVNPINPIGGNMLNQNQPPQSNSNMMGGNMAMGNQPAMNYQQNPPLQNNNNNNFNMMSNNQPPQGFTGQNQMNFGMNSNPMVGQPPQQSNNFNMNEMGFNKPMLQHPPQDFNQNMNSNTNFNFNPQPQPQPSWGIELDLNNLGSNMGGKMAQNNWNSNYGMSMGMGGQMNSNANFAYNTGSNSANNQNALSALDSLF